MDPTRLSGALASPSPPVVLDVRLADDFEAAHIPGAIHNPVFEVAFLQRLAEQLPDKSAAVVVCGASGASLEAAMAAEKLVRAGHASVAVLDGGLERWQGAGLPVDAGAPLPAEPDPPDGRVAVDLAESRVGWTGRNLLNKHHGTVPLKSGHLEFDGGRLTGGEIVLDLTRLECADLAGSDLHDILVRHLHDHDFFDVGRHPEARLVITGAEPLVGATAGALNVRLAAELTLRGQTHGIVFDAAAGLTPDGRPAAQAAFAIDRTRWGVLYGSGRFFHRLAGHLVNDLIEFDVRVVGC